MKDLEDKLRNLIVESLELEDIRPGDIQLEEPLFGDGLGLDSIDALELGLALQKTFGVSINAEDEAAREHFRSLKTLAAFVAAAAPAAASAADEERQHEAAAGAAAASAASATGGGA